MRRVAISVLALVLALGCAGCNAIFGLKDTHVVDAQPDAPFAHVQLLYQVANTNLLDPDPALERRGIPIPDVTVRVGRPGDDLIAAEYSTDGAVGVPDIIFAAPTWRLEYTVAGAVPTELQWSPVGDQGVAIVPIYGRINRGTIPSGSGYHLVPPGAAPNPFHDVHVFTTGIWSDSARGVANPVDLPLAAMVPLSGAPGAPEPAKGDTAIVVDYDTRPSPCTRVTVGSGEATVGAPTAGSLTSVPIPAYAPTAGPVAFFNYSPNSALVVGRVGTMLGSRAGTQSADVLYGYTPHDQQPAFVRDVANQLPSAVLLPLATCDFPNTSSTPTNANAFTLPPALNNFPQLAVTQVRNTRMLGGIPLVSGIAAAGTANQATSATTPIVMDLRTPMPTAPIQLAGIDLAGATDAVPVTVGSASMTLQFDLESVGDLIPPDYAEVTMYRVQGKLIPEHIFVTAKTLPPIAVTIEPSAFTAGTEYVFGLRTYRGRPNARSGDFRTATYPQAVATAFTRSIVAK